MTLHVSTDPRFNRCLPCGFPLKASAADGCVPGDCSFRPSSPGDQAEWEATSARRDQAQEIFDAIRATLVEFLGVDQDRVTWDVEIVSKSDAEGLAADSLDRVELMMALEERFGLEIPDDDVVLPEMNCPAGIVAYVFHRRQG